MRMLLSYSHHALRRTPTAAGALCLALAACLSGCATTRNPLIDDAPAPQAAAAATAAPAAEGSAPGTAPVATAAESGVKTTGPSKLQRVFGIFSPYRITIQQGNFVSEEMVAQLNPGMTQEQVRFVLGTPLLTDLFHADRWDYLFRLQKGDGELTTSRVTLFFKDKRLDHFEGGNLPTENEYIARIAGAPQKATDAAPEAAPPQIHITK
ncbi:outer membrane protein assembly factor BamE [Undibacterium arcticum]|uniref:Outer membrane protein assembly factor BamE n=1 Tax=Undibacterium arcticum TaxID=1762892 RepID=A0ABV7F9J4_9BURK